MTIKLNKDTHEKEGICELIKQSIMNTQYELECIIGGNYNLGSTITHQQFRKILGRIKGKKEYQMKASDERLVISFPRDTKFSSIRVLVNGNGAINYYCINEKLDGIIHNVVFQEKVPVAEKKNKVFVPNYNLKFNQKLERDIETDSALVRELLRDWQEIPKVFRYKKSYQHLTMPDRMFSLDCSIVRTSGFEDRELSVREVLNRDLFHNVVPADEKIPFAEWWKQISKNPEAKVKVRDVNIYYKTIKESRVFERDFLYEVEVEFKNSVTTPGNGTLPRTLKQEYTDAADKTVYINDIFNKFFRQIGVILQCVQDSFHLIGNTDFLNVLESYGRLTGVRKGVENMFFGPLPIDLDINKLIEFPANVYDDMNRVYENGNIVLDYCVTDKSDGVRCLLYINGQGRTYLIVRDGVAYIKDMGLNIPSYANSVFDGEYIEVDKDGGFLNRYYMFDAYFVRGQNIMNKPFGRGKEPGGRLYEIAHLVDTFIAGLGVNIEGVDPKNIHQSTKYMFRLEKKNFLFGESSKTPSHIRRYDLIFNQCNAILGKMNHEYGGKLSEGHLFTYKTDGLIFTPVELGVYHSELGTTLPPYVLVSSRKWQQVYKWKSIDMLSIDLRIDFPKDSVTKERSTIYIGSNKYIRCHLLTRNYDSHSWDTGKRRFNPEKLESGLSSQLLNDNASLYNMPGEIPFKPIYPFLGSRDVDGNIQIMTHEALLPVSLGGEIKCENGDIINQDSVVEFIYDSNMDHKYENEAMRWKPTRVRYGKTPNALNTCLDIWGLIHSPISTETISLGLTVAKAAETQNLNYYLHGKHLLTDGLKKFNNFVKGWIMERYIKQMTSPRVLDISCGKLGDFFKYVNLGVGTLVGMDLNFDNLNNKVDGAATRVLQSMSNSPRVKALANKTLLIMGDFTRNLADGSAAVDELGRYYLDILYGRHKPSVSFNSKHAKFYNLGTEGFHAVICHFSIHYAMGNYTAIESYFENISQNLREQGYFIGTCLDGNNILDALNKSNNYLEGRVNGHTIWSIDRRDLNPVEERGLLYDESGEVIDTVSLNQYSTDMPHIIGPGNKVNMYFETMNTISMENLVDINYLAFIAKRHNLKLIESRLFTEEPGNLLIEWGSIDKPTTGDKPGKTDGTAQMIAEIKKEKGLNDWARYQRYFVFQKVPHFG